MLLLVDDNDEFRLAAAEALEAAGLEVVQAADAEEASAIFAEEEISLLVTDLRLPSSRPAPVSAGEELAKECLAKNPQLPVIVVSSHADADLPTRLGSARVEILAKPFPLEKLARRSIALLAGEPAESTGALPAAVMRKREETTGNIRTRGGRQGKKAWPAAIGALALVLALGAGGVTYVLARKEPPPAPEKPVAETPASAAIEPLAPIGPIGELPQELRWQPYAGSNLYKVALRGVDENVLWRGETRASRIDLPQEVGQELRPALAYYWSVEAMSDRGEKLAAAPKVRFRFVPPSKAAGP
jgi:CheY-like chemotaxis protein